MMEFFAKGLWSNDFEQSVDWFQLPVGNDSLMGK